MAQTGYFEALQANFSRLIPHAQECGIAIERLDAGGALALKERITSSPRAKDCT